MSTNNDLPMWGIVGDEGLDELAEIIAEIRDEIIDIEKEILQKEAELDAINGRLNIYIKNALCIEDYDNTKDLIVINEKNEASIYPQSILDDETIDVKNLPNSEKTYKVTKKQSEKIVEYMESYSYIVYDYEDLIEEYDEIVDYHDQLWDNIHESLCDSKFLKVYSKETIDIEEQIEPFNKKKHLLLIVKNEDGNWGFKYIRKKDEKKFFKMVQDKKEEN